MITIRLTAKQFRTLLNGLRWGLRDQHTLQEAYGDRFNDYQTPAPGNEEYWKEIGKDIRELGKLIKKVKNDAEKSKNISKKAS